MIMAGGQGTRMARSGVAVPKALVPVAGVPMLERNFLQLARHGFGRVVVAVPGGDSPVGDFAHAALAPLARRLGIAFEVRPETAPLGNIGAVQTESGAETPLLVVYADNLTALDLAAIHAAHLASGAALTLAVHEQPFRMPFGEVVLEGERVTGYREKPVWRVPVCSAVMVLAPAAIRSIAPGEAIGISDLAQRMIALGLPVHAFRHEDPWIDVNEQADIAAAEAMIAAHPAAFAGTAGSGD